MIAHNFLYVYKLSINWHSGQELSCSSCYDVCIRKSRRNFMTRSQACRILGVSIDADMQEIKKSYRQLMHKVHPDTDAFHKTEYDYSVQEINEAYTFLFKSDNRLNGLASRTSSSDLLHALLHSILLPDFLLMHPLMLRRKNAGMPRSIHTLMPNATSTTT